MTPAARIQAAIEILDRVIAGAAAEQALTAWARASRFAGSGDRAAIRDHVFDVLRCRRSYLAMSGTATLSGRALMIGATLANGRDPAELFTGEGYAPDVLDRQEIAVLTGAEGIEHLDPLVALDCPEWLGPSLQRSLGADFVPVLQAMRARAPVMVRVNARRISRDDAQSLLAENDIISRPHSLAKNALELVVNARRIGRSKAFLQGQVELQDAAPQAAVEALPLRAGSRVLDYCAGGGGKSLAMAGRVTADYVAHDISPERMRDLPARAGRAGAKIRMATTEQLQNDAPFNLVLVDVPCSGTGTWRRSPAAKWDLEPGRLAELMEIQAGIVDNAKRYVAPGGVLAYMTCSLLQEENEDQISAFLARDPAWNLTAFRQYTPLDGGDGFFTAHLTRS